MAVEATKSASNPSGFCKATCELCYIRPEQPVTSLLQTFTVRHSTLSPKLRLRLSNKQHSQTFDLSVILKCIKCLPNHSVLGTFPFSTWQKQISTYGSTAKHVLVQTETSFRFLQNYMYMLNPVVHANCSAYKRLLNVKHLY